MQPVCGSYTGHTNLSISIKRKKTYDAVFRKKPSLTKHHGKWSPFKVNRRSQHKLSWLTCGRVCLRLGGGAWQTQGDRGRWSPVLQRLGQTWSALMWWSLRVFRRRRSRTATPPDAVTDTVKDSADSSKHRNNESSKHRNNETSQQRNNETSQQRNNENSQPRDPKQRIKRLKTSCEPGD